jgi:hypothetical protein
MTRMDTNYNAEFPLTVVLVVSVDSVMPVYWIHLWVAMLSLQGLPYG